MYTRAERWWWSAFALVVVGVFGGLASIQAWVGQNVTLRYAIAIAAALAPVLAALSRYRAGICSGRGDLCRRAVLYRDALGVELELDELRSVALWPRDIPLSTATTSTPYFASAETQGPARLADEVGESAFQTAELARIMAGLGLGLVLIVGVAILAALAGLPSLSTNSATMGELSSAIATAATVTLALLFGEILVTALAYRSLEIECSSVFRSATQFKSLPEKSSVTAMRIGEAYSIALAANLPIPDLLYRWNRTRIQAAYGASQGKP
jgi:hypothetical protein